MSAIYLKSLGEKELTEFFDSFDTVLTDCDGVLWVLMAPIANAANAVNTFMNIGKKVFYVTNNSTKTREELVEKFTLLGFKANLEDVICTSHLAGCYLKSIAFQKKVYVIGTSGITKELDKVGIPHVGTGPDVMDTTVAGFSFTKDSDIGAVIVGFDEHFSYPKMVKAATYLNDKNILFIGTNTDERFPTSDNMVIPGTGSIVRCIETCSQRNATIMGKPEPYIADMIKKEHNVNPKRTLMIGDRANTDILLGSRCGFKTLLVLSGTTSLSEVEQWKQSDNEEDKKLIPDYYIDSIGDLCPLLQAYKSRKEKL